MVTNEPIAHNQFFSIKKIRVHIGTDKTSAVNKESCLGEMFLVEIILRRYKEEKGTRLKEQASDSLAQLQR